MARCNDFKKLLGLPVIFWAQDFHSRRQSLGEKLGGASAHTSLLSSLGEKLAIDAADIAIFPTREEAYAASRKFLSSNIGQHPYFAFESAEPVRALQRKNNIIFIGSSGHQPNPDGLKWFLAFCWPSIRNKFSETQLRIIGDWENSDLANEYHQGVEFVGKIPEAQVEEIMRTGLIGISPLRFGAGMKRKTLQYLLFGLATVATDFGLEGLPSELDSKCWFRANSAEEFTNVISKILEESKQAQLVAQKGSDYVLKHFSEDVFDSRLLEILCKVGL
jgi:glycosyltransferase involved in cell wall biosynthesis